MTHDTHDTSKSSIDNPCVCILFLLLARRNVELPIPLGRLLDCNHSILRTCHSLYLLGKSCAQTGRIASCNPRRFLFLHLNIFFETLFYGRLPYFTFWLPCSQSGRAANEPVLVYLLSSSAPALCPLSIVTFCGCSHVGGWTTR